MKIHFDRSKLGMILVASIMVFCFASGLSDAKAINRKYDGEPVWSPDGTQIAFVSQATGGSDLWVMNSDGSNPINLTPNGDKNPNIKTNIDWSKDGTFLSFTEIEGHGVWNIWTVTLDGTGLTNVTKETDSINASGGNCLLSDKRILFISNRSGTNEVWTINSDGTGLLNLTPDNKDELTILTCSSDEKYAVYTLDNQNTSQVWRISLSTFRSEKLIDDAIGSLWSPDGKYVAVTMNNQDIVRINMENFHKLALVSHLSSDRINTPLWWSSDGGNLFIESVSDTSMLIVRINTQSLGRKVFFDEQKLRILSPVLSPDGKFLAFESYTNDDTDVYVMNLDDMIRINLTGSQHGNS